jgi:hypothetical protein
MRNKIPTSAGIPQRDADFRARDDWAYKASTGRLTAAETGFVTVKNGVHMSAHGMSQDMSSGLANEFAPQNPRTARRPNGPVPVPMPYPEYEPRDDLRKKRRMVPGI